MIKKLGALALTILYSVTVMGFALNVHYCGGYLASVKINTPIKSCAMLSAGKMKCCTNKHIEVKVKDVHQGKPAANLSTINPYGLPMLFLVELSASAKQGFSAAILYRGPPNVFVNNRPIFLRNAVFRI